MALVLVPVRVGCYHSQMPGCMRSPNLENSNSVQRHQYLFLHGLGTPSYARYLEVRHRKHAAAAGGAVPIAVGIYPRLG